MESDSEKTCAVVCMNRTAAVVGCSDLHSSDFFMAFFDARHPAKVTASNASWIDDRDDVGACDTSLTSPGCVLDDPPDPCSWRTIRIMRPGAGVCPFHVHARTCKCTIFCDT